MRQYIDDKTTSRELARIYDVSVRTIIRRLAAGGVNLKARRRRPGGPLHEIHGYLTSLDRGRRPCRIHRACWEAYHGPIPKGWVVHHINSDTFDNRIENLACMPRGEHTRLHRW